MRFKFEKDGEHTVVRSNGATVSSTAGFKYAGRMAELALNRCNMPCKVLILGGGLGSMAAFVAANMILAAPLEANQCGIDVVERDKGMIENALDLRNYPMSISTICDDAVDYVYAYSHQYKKNQYHYQAILVDLFMDTIQIPPKILSFDFWESLVFLGVSIYVNVIRDSDLIQLLRHAKETHGVAAIDYPSLGNKILFVRYGMGSYARDLKGHTIDFRHDKVRKFPWSSPQPEPSVDFNFASLGTCGLDIDIKEV
jgi:hypothetical protein